jgi:exonuclease SbcD
MRLLHTSDWHLGKKFEDIDLLPQQEAFANQLIDIVRDQKVDAVLVAGDIYDRSTPNAEAVSLADNIFARLIREGVQVIAISGNHDSAERLRFGSAAMAEAGLHIRAEHRLISVMGAPITVTSRDGRETVQVVPVPYIDPYRVEIVEGVERLHHTMIAEVLKRNITAVGNPAHAIAMAHAFVAGGSSTESEKQLNVGGTDRVPLSVFDGFGYVALGHLHEPQEFGDDRLIYSGSPLSYSFSEQHDKSVRIIECGDREPTSSTITIDVGHRVLTLKDSLDSLLSSSQYDDTHGALLRIDVTDTTPILGLIDKVRERFTNVVQVRQLDIKRPEHHVHLYRPDGERKTPTDLIDDYVTKTFEQTLNDTQTTLIHNVLTSVLRGDNS